MTVWGDADEDDARAPLKTLEGAGLLEPAGTPGRYQQHRLLRAYARALLDREGETEEAAGRHFTFYADLHGAKRDHTDSDYLQSITVDLENLTAAFHWGSEHAAEAACDLLSALDNYLRVYQSTAVYRPLLEQALEAARQIEYQWGEANTLRALGDLSVRQDELEAAKAYYDAALTIFRAIGDRLGEANTLRALGDLSVRQGDLNGARQLYDLADGLYTQISDLTGRMNVLIGNARLARAQNDLDSAKFYFERLFEFTDDHPAYREHPITQNLKREYQQLVGNSKSTLPDEAIQQLAGNTYAVMTSHSTQHSEWREQLQSTREEFAGRGEEYEIEVAFADALLSILDGGSPKLPEDNPYADVIQQVINAIAEYRLANDVQ